MRQRLFQTELYSKPNGSLGEISKFRFAICQQMFKKKKKKQKQFYLRKYSIPSDCYLVERPFATILGRMVLRRTTIISSRFVPDCSGWLGDACRSFLNSATDSDWILNDIVGHSVER